MGERVRLGSTELQYLLYGSECGVADRYFIRPLDMSQTILRLMKHEKYNTEEWFGRLVRKMNCMQHRYFVFIYLIYYLSSRPVQPNLNLNE